LASFRFRKPNVLSRLRNLDRMREISTAAIRHGFGYFIEGRRFFGLLPRRRKKELDLPTHRGRHVREMLDELGPTFIKFGQLLSTRPDIIPSDIVEELALLQDRVAPFPFALAKQVIEHDLGLSLERAFETFDEEPIAAASIGQVYAATLPGGHEVVVKVQRPTAPKNIRNDIDLLMQLAEMTENRIDVGFSPTDLVQEFARSINRELDYILEARNAERFAVNFEGYDSVVIPAVYWRYCSPRVLTMDRIVGPALNSQEVSDLPLGEKKKVATTLADCWFKQIFRDGFFHADPHPANILLLEGGRLGIIDFGQAGFLREADLQEGVRLFMHVMDSDAQGIKRSLKRLGLRWNPSVDEAVTQTIEEAFSRYFGRSLSNMDAATLLRQIFEVIFALRLKLPGRFLLLDKALITLEGVVGTLYPDLNIFQLAGRYTKELKRQRSDPRVLADRVTNAMAKYAGVFSDYPLQLHDLLDELRAGELEIKYRHTGLENVVRRLDIIMNRLVVALVSIALGVTSTAIGILVETGPQVWGLSAWGLPGFAGSLFFGVWLIWAIIRSGRL
jgi:ubiquinone biosynthesis protein